MIFESLWPLLFLCAVPIIIILYLLKPKGKDQKVASNLLWQKLFKNQESKTFFEKFVHNILMYLQILIVALLAVALMSPYIHVEGRNGGHVIFVMDTSGSMQHKNAKGQTRMEESVRAACDYVDASDQTTFSVVTNDALGTDLLVVGSADKSAVKSALNSIACSDAAGNLTDAESLVETLYSGGEEDAKASVIIFTDGAGEAAAGTFVKYMEAEVSVAGEVCSNLSNDFLSYVLTEDGYDVVCSITNYSDLAASCEVSLYEGEDKLLAIRQMTVEAGESSVCLFSDIAWEGDFLKSVIGAVSFSGESRTDSLEADNTSYAVREESSRANAVLIGSGNTYIEKAFRAATGKDVVKSDTDQLTSEEDYNVIIYDAGEKISYDSNWNRLVFGDNGNSAGKVENVMLSASAGTLTSGLSEYQIGVNRAYYYELPEWAESFLECDGKCIGYFGEHDGRKEVVVGFDIRESDFPLKAEFPIFISNVMNYLSDTSLLAANQYVAGETVVFQPQSDIDISELSASTEKAGLYTVSAGDMEESYVVRFAADTESDGRVLAESVNKADEYEALKVKKTLRNVFLILALILFVIEWIIYVRQMRYRGKFYLIVRIVGAVCLLLAIIGFSVKIGSGKNTTVFIVDVSDSNISNTEAMNAYLSKTIKEKPGNHQYGIVAFGKSSMVEQFLTEKNFFSGLMSAPDKTATNMEEALSRALAMMPAGSSGRIVVLSDGKETKGNINNTAKALVANQVELLAMVYDTPQTKDAFIEHVAIPTYLHPGDEYSITVSIKSNYDTDAVVDLISGSMTIQSSSVHLNKGSNQFVLKQKVTGESMESFQVVVRAPEDTCAENDSYNIYSVVEAAPKVLVISGMDEDSTNFSALLEAAGCNYQIVSALNAPDNITDMLEYKSIVLENVYLDDLPNGLLASLDSYVKDYGCGLVCCGGEDSFALGGYRDTAIEDVLPVNMELRGVDEIPSMAMVMVIDRSGSMMDTAGDGSGAANLDIAIKAATVAVDNLREKDYVGVLTFDDRYTWQVEITEASDKKAINDKIKAINEGGGTTIKPALQEAFNAISKCDAVIKHVVLLTDGMGETTNYSDIISAFNDSDITLSTVAVGTGSDTRLLENLADSCGGRYYYSDISSDIPKIFAQEVFLSGDTYIQNGDFALSVKTGHELTQGLFMEGWPNISGYISASPKTASTVVIASSKDDPVLTVWQYGLGHTVAWNTDVTNQWTGAYAGRDDYAALWKRIIDYSTGNASLGEDSAEITTVGGSTTIQYTTDDYENQTRITALYTGPDGELGEVSFHAVAPGKYEAELDTPQIGIYNFSVRRLDGNEITNSINTAAVVQFSDEYRFDVKNDNFLSFVEQYGALIDEGDFVWKNQKSMAKEKVDLTLLLTVLTLLIFLFDVAVRRFHFTPAETRLYRNLSARRKAAKEARAADVKKRISGRSAGTSANAAAETETKAKAPGNAYGDAVNSTVSSPKAAAQTTEQVGAGEKKKPGKEKKASKKKVEAAVLDTSQLLKKKDDRNM